MTDAGPLPSLAGWPRAPTSGKCDMTVFFVFPSPARHARVSESEMPAAHPMATSSGARLCYRRLHAGAVKPACCRNPLNPAHAAIPPKSVLFSLRLRPRPVLWQKQAHCWSISLLCMSVSVLRQCRWKPSETAGADTDFALQGDARGEANVNVCGQASMPCQLRARRPSLCFWDHQQHVCHQVHRAASVWLQRQSYQSTA